MSLINDMLVDLESRRGGSAPAGNDLLHDVHAAPRRHTPVASDLSRWLIATMIGVTAACAAYYGLRLIENNAAGYAAIVDHNAELAVSPAAAVGNKPPVAVAAPELLPEPLPAPAAVVADATTIISPQVGAADVPTADASAVAAADASTVTVEAVPLQALHQREDNKHAAGVIDTEPEPVVLVEAVEEQAPVEHHGSLRVHEIHGPASPRAALSEILHRATDSSAWRDELNAFVDANPTLPSARTALVQSWLRAGDAVRAETLLRGGLEIAPEHAGFASMLAHLLVARGQADAALATLNGLPEAALDADVRAFIAALEQRRGHHDKAIAAYRQALSAIPRRGAWWVGLGISLSADQQPGPASDAFRKALSDTQLSDNLRQFAQAQLGRLNGNS